LERMIEETELKMREAAKELDFITAAQYRDEVFALKKRLKEAG
ncbi:MAG: UvrB/UvrC motif-containing protein, partial [Saprospiraceae bacterium]|nr:UvrB/UvrC motif-containing protein [Saprospiraceae bacterium]